MNKNVTAYTRGHSLLIAALSVFLTTACESTEDENVDSGGGSNTADGGFGALDGAANDTAPPIDGAASALPAACSAGAYVENETPVYCFSSEVRRVPAFPEARVLFEEAMKTVGVEDSLEDLFWLVLPKQFVMTPDAQALWKPDVNKGRRVGLIQMNEALDLWPDDGSLILALVHEIGHIMQYRRGEPAGDELLAKLCTAKNLDQQACTTAVTAHLLAREIDADDYMIRVIASWPQKQLATRLPFDPWSFVDVLSAPGPSSPTHPPGPERAAKVSAALTAAGVPRPAAGTPPQRRYLSALGGFGARTLQAVAAQGPLPQ